MIRILSFFTKTLIYIFLGLIVISMVWLALAWISQSKLNRKSRIIYDQAEAGKTTAAELFKIKPNEFFCLEQIYQSRPSKRHDYSALKKEGLNIDNVPSYDRWPFEMVMWDPDDIRIMALSHDGKLRRVSLLARDTVSTHSWPRYFGCFHSNHPIQISFKSGNNTLKLEFPSVARK